MSSPRPAVLLALLMAALPSSACDGDSRHTPDDDAVAPLPAVAIMAGVHFEDI